MKQEKLCLWCRYFLIDLGTDDYSDLTPGESPECQCCKGHWKLDRHNFTMRAYRHGMLKARDCPEFVLDRT